MNTDHELADRVRAELALEPGIEIDNIQIEVHDGIVTLTGHVASLEATSLAERCVMRQEGAQAVINELSVWSE